MQLPGQLITDDGERIGLIRAVSSTSVPQPDLLVKDRATREVVQRIGRPDLEVEAVDVDWEDGTHDTLVQTVDHYINLGSVVELGKNDTGLDDQAQAAVDAVGERLAKYCDEVREAAPFAEIAREADRVLDVVEDTEEG